VSGTVDKLAGVTRLGLDTSPVIYFVEANPVYDARVAAIFKRIDAGTLAGITSIITLAEVLVQPLRHGDLTLQAAYRRLLLHSLNFSVLPIDAAAAERAADLRARYNLRLPDALQVAVALTAGCEGFLTNDSSLNRVTELRVLVLDELSP
jgi:predicted nucleic acid-binding protein